MAIILRYNTTDRSAISFTGNTLGLLGTFNPSAASTTVDADGIGTFTTNNTALTSPGGYPAGTTQTFSQNSSTAILDMLSGSSVLYAELIWSGVYQNALQNVSASINNAVQFRGPSGTTYNISPDPTTAQTLPGFAFQANSYARTANVTNIVKSEGAGSYTLSNVPGALGGSTSSSPNTVETNYLGWCLAVVYRNDALPFRNSVIWVLLSNVTTSASPTDIPVVGFLTPTTGTLSARLALSAGGGDSYINGDTCLFGPTIASLTTLSGTNNPANNFFASQINIANSSSPQVGQLNTTGTFGNRNQPLGTKSTAGRQGWDITNVNASAALINNQSSAVLRLTTTGDFYAPTALGLQIDISSVDLNLDIAKSVNKKYAQVGETVTYQITLNNTGEITATNVIVIDTIPSSTTFRPNSMLVNGVPSPLVPQAPGVNLGTIGVNQVATISFDVIVNTLPNPNVAINTAGVGFTFTPNTITNPVSFFEPTNAVTTTIVSTSLSSSKIVNKAVAGVGEVLTYTIPITNYGNNTATNVLFIDTIPNGTSLVAGSFTQDGNPVAGSPNPPGATLSNIGPGVTSTVVFRVRINTFPTPNPIPNFATTNYSYTIDPTTSPATTGSGSTSTNTVNTQVNGASLGTLFKFVDKSYASCGDILTYTISIPNNGNATATNVVVSDTVPNGTVYVINSILVNGVASGATSPSNIPIGTIAPGATATASFSVRVPCN